MKKLIKILCISIVLLILLIICFKLFIRHNKNTKQVTILAYHNIIPDDLEKDSNEYDILIVSEFKEQMNYLKESGYETITANQLYEWKQGNIEIPDKSLLITFDDGYTSFKYLVEPILEEYNFNAICFVIGNSTPETTLEYDPNIYSTVGKDEIKNHIENVEYGSHTYSLHYLTENGEKAVRTLDNNKLIEDTENFKNNVFNAEYLAYPYYTYTEDYIEVLKQYNYKLAFAGEEEMATRKVNNYKIPRISGAKSIDEFKEIFETDKYRNKYGNGLIRKICVNIERKIGGSL